MSARRAFEERFTERDALVAPALTLQQGGDVYAAQLQQDLSGDRLPGVVGDDASVGRAFAGPRARRPCGLCRNGGSPAVRSGIEGRKSSPRLPQWEPGSIRGQGMPPRKFEVQHTMRFRRMRS